MIVYNALGSQKSRIVCLPVSSLGEFVVSRVGDHATGSAETILYSVPSAFPLLSSTAAKYTLAFDTGPLTPAGATVFRIIQSPRHRLENEILTGRLMKSRSLNYESDTTKGLDIDQVTVSNEFLTVQFNRLVLIGEYVLCIVSISLTSCVTTSGALVQYCLFKRTIQL